MKRRWVLVLLMASLSLPAFAAGPRDGLSGYRYLLGRISLQHVQVCLGNQDEEWVDPHYEAGFVRLVTRWDLTLKALEGKAALLWGKVDTDKHFPHPGHKGHCPERQTRMDWILSKNGMRLLRKIPQLRPGSFSVVRAQAFDGLGVKLDGEEILVTLTSHLPVDLSDLELVVHYEGCYGKPDSVAKSQSFGVLSAGKTVTARFPTRHRLEKNPGSLWPAEGRRDHVAYSLQLRSKDPRVLVDLDLPLSALLGKRLRCHEEESGEKRKSR